MKAWHCSISRLFCGQRGSAEIAVESERANAGMLLGSASHGERGQGLALAAFGIVALLGMASLAIDVSSWRYQQRLEQSAADSAAVAGAIRLSYPTTSNGGTAPVEVTAAAQGASKDNGFTDDGGVGKLTVTVNSPPLASPTSYPSNTAVEVIVKKDQPAFFSRIFGKQGSFVSARAVAARKPDGAYCLYQLDPNGSLLMRPPGLVNAVNCGVIYNGTIPLGHVTATSLSYTNPANSPGASLTPPLVAQRSLPFSDPCSAIAGCAYLQQSTFPPASLARDASGYATLSPGVYNNCCSTVTLNPGIYYIYGGIGVSGAGTITGTGVTIVNIDGPIRFNGNGGMNINAPSGPYDPMTNPTAGVAFYQPPSNTNDYLANGNPGFFGGMFYAPTLHYRTNGKGDTFSFLVIGGTDLRGNKPLTVDPSLTSPAIAVSSQATHVVLSE